MAAVQPSSSCALGSALYSSKPFITLKSPPLAATIIGVCPSVSLALIFAPRFSKYSMRVESRAMVALCSSCSSVEPCLSASSIMAGNATGSDCLGMSADCAILMRGLYLPCEGKSPETTQLSHLTNGTPYSSNTFLILSFPFSITASMLALRSFAFLRIPIASENSSCVASSIVFTGTMVIGAFFMVLYQPANGPQTAATSNSPSTICCTVMCG